MKTFYTLFLFILMNQYAQDIDQIKNKLKEVGLSPEQAKQIAKEKGYSNSELENEAKARGINLNNIESLDENEKIIENSNIFYDIDSNKSDNETSDGVSLPNDDILQYKRAVVIVKCYDNKC